MKLYCRKIVAEVTVSDGYLTNGSEQNNSNNKLTFSITDDGGDKEGFHIDFINYEEPEGEKEVKNGTNSGSNESSFTGTFDLTEYTGTYYYTHEPNHTGIIKSGTYNTSKKVHILETL